MPIGILKSLRKRFSSMPATVSFEQIKSIINKNDQNNIIIDVRRLDEVKLTGLIPTSHHIPLAELQLAFEKPKDRFEEDYGFEKPNNEQTLIFSCFAGMRAKSAMEMVEKLGYKTAYYSGSWSEWSARNK